MNATREIVRPLSEWSEEDGDVLWWKFPVDESPYVGSPLHLGQTVEAHGHKGLLARFDVGGWPGYHTHWTKLPPVPLEPLDHQYEKAKQFVVVHQNASVSFVQRMLGIGYNAAARMVERMQEEGVVSRPDGAGKRECLWAKLT